MKVRNAILLVAIGLVIVAIAIGLAIWPKLPARTTPRPALHGANA